MYLNDVVSKERIATSMLREPFVSHHALTNNPSKPFNLAVKRPMIRELDDATKSAYRITNTELLKEEIRVFKLNHPVQPLQHGLWWAEDEVDASYIFGTHGPDVPKYAYYKAAQGNAVQYFDHALLNYIEGYTTHVLFPSTVNELNHYRTLIYNIPENTLQYLDPLGNETYCCPAVRNQKS
uniref:Uncharacterized protein n=1 Tax=Panagrolaimus superbus TaxID=310955 RepID=A0A914YAH5_9BILA